MTSQFVDMTSSSKLFDVVLFLLSSLVTGPSFMSISSLVLELWQFSFIRDWSEIRKSEYPRLSFAQFLEAVASELGIPNLARMSRIKYYWMLQNVRVTAFTISELLRENHQWDKIARHTQIRVKKILIPKHKGGTGVRVCGRSAPWEQPWKE